MSRKLQDSTWDNQALNLTSKQTDHSLAEFDLSMWSMLKMLSEQENEFWIEEFQFSKASVQALIDSQLKDLELLSSGEILSFTVKNDEKEIIRILGEPCGPDIIYKKILGPNKPMAHQYWNLAKRFAERADNEDENLYDVSLQFGLNLDVLKALKNCTDNQIFCLAETIDTKFGIRFDESLIHRILKSHLDPKNSIHVLTMLKFQQTISSSIGLNTGREMVYSSNNLLTLKQFSDSDNNNRLSKHSLVRTLLARYLLISGAAVNIVQIETGYTQKNIYRLRSIIQSDGLRIKNNRSKSQMSAISIITNINKSIQASLVMVLYYFHSQSYENIPIDQNLNLIPLLRAYRSFHQIMNVTQFFDSDKGIIKKSPPINFSECWTLARELRSNEACILKSNRFNCYYFSSQNQKVSTNCPFESPLSEITNTSHTKKANINYLKDEFGDFDVPNLIGDDEILRINQYNNRQIRFNPD